MQSPFGRLPLDELVRQFLSSAAAGILRPGTLLYYRTQLTHLVEDLGGHTLVALVRSTDLERVCVKRSRVQVAKRLFRWASRAGLGRNPAQDLIAPPVGTRDRVVTRQEVAELLATCSRDFARLLQLAYRTGARPGELRALTWANVDLAERRAVLTVFKCRARRRDGVRHRVILLDRRSLRILSRWKQERQPKMSDPVLLTARGVGWTPTAVRLRMRRLRRKLGPDFAGVCVYTMRHTRATELLQARTPDSMVAELLGHTDVRTTRRYLHPVRADLLEVLDAAADRHLKPTIRAR